jgi:ATP-dependent helicase/nuclease subunit B
MGQPQRFWFPNTALFQNNPIREVNMGLRYVLGLPGTGKTAMCLDEILVKDKEAGGASAIYIVPEQYSMHAEKSLVERSASSAVTKAQALSFQRMAFHLFSKTGRPAGAFLDDTGKSMLLRKIVLDLRASLVFYGKSSDKQGFIDGLSRLITEFHQYGVTCEDLVEMQGEGASESLRAKMRDLHKIFERYLDVMRDRYFSLDATLDFLPDKLKQSDFLDGAHVFIDNFHGFTKQERRILAQIMKKAKRVTVTATVDEKAISFSGLLETDFFYETKLTMNKLTLLAREEGIAIEEPVFLDKPHSFAQMNFFISNFFKRRTAVCPFPVSTQEEGKPKTGFFLVSARDAEDEVTQAAELAVSLARDEGMRYRDIAVLCSNIGAYEKILRRVFNTFDIPLFIDIKSDIMSHPLTELICAATEIAAKHWSYESVFRFLKTDMSGISMQDVDILENYVLAYGVKGRQWQAEEWDRGERLEDILRIKAQVQDALSPFVKGTINKRDTVRGFAGKIYAMLDHINATGTLDRWIQEMASQGAHEVARRHSQIWGKVSAVFDKMVEILGDEVVSVPEFSKILNAGLSTASMGVIPPSVDQVVIGEVARSRLPDVKVLIVLGANDGVMPRASSETGFFNDNDRLYLMAHGVELASDSKRKMGEEHFLLYCALTKPRERLVLSCSQTSGSKLSRPAGAVVKLQKMHQDLKFFSYAQDRSITSARPMVGRMGALIKKHLSGEEMTDEFKDVYAILKDDPKALSTLVRFEEFIKECETPKRISAKAAAKLYGKELNTSVSRLEKYAECPFGYYLIYNLKAKERKTHTVTALDTGNLFHNVLERFSENLETESTSWRDVDTDSISRMVDYLVDDLAPEFGANVFSSQARLIYMLGRIKRICKRSIWALSEHIKKGQFEPLGVEVAFKPDSPLSSIELALNGERKLVLTGRIDRIDILDAENKRYVKIIDYKSGNKKFDIDDVYFGSQLQLIMYLNAFIKNAKEFVGDEAEIQTLPGGVFYFNINDPIVNFDDDEDSPDAMEKLQEMILKTFKMSGLVLSDPEAIMGMDENLSGDSAIIPVSVKKDGELGARSSILDYEGFVELQKSVEEKAVDIGNAILTGSIEAYPFKKGELTACDYCLYSAICGLEISEKPNKYHLVKGRKAFSL